MRYLSYQRPDSQGLVVLVTARYCQSALEEAQQEALWDIIPEDDEPWWDQDFQQE